MADDTSQYLHGDWEQVFLSILQLLDDYEHHVTTSDISIRENISYRLESDRSNSTTFVHTRFERSRVCTISSTARRKHS